MTLSQPTRSRRGALADEPRPRPLLAVALAFSAGIAVDRYWPLGFADWWLFGLAAALAWFAAQRHGRVRSGGALVLLMTAAAGGAWHHARWSLFAPDDVAAFAEREAAPAAIEAVAVSSPERIPPPPFDPMAAVPRSVRTRIDVEVHRIRDDGAWLPASGRAALIVDGQLVDIGVGDRLRMFVQLDRPTPPLNPGEFDYAAQARGRRQLAVLRANYPDCVQRLTSPSSWDPRYWLPRLRARADRTLSSELDRDRAGVARALLLGQRDEIDLEVSDAFFETGTIHLLSISGLHVAILASALFLALRLGLLPRGPALGFVAATTCAYALFVNAEAPVVRAAALVTLSCLALYLGRRPLSLNVLAGALLIVLALNPADLFRTGPQLSFLAVAALGALALAAERRQEVDPLDRLIARTRPWSIRLARRVGKYVAWTMIASAVVWAVTSPLVAGRFHLVSPVGLVLSPLLVPPVTIALLSGFALLTVGWLAQPLVRPLAWLCDTSLAWLETGVETANGAPLGHFWAPGPADWWLVGLYAGLGIWAMAPRWRPPARWVLTAAAAWTAVGFAASLARHLLHDRLECTFLSVGHGCAVVVELPDGRTLLYDAGQLGSPRGGARRIAGHLWSRGATHIDAVVISHADVDHYGSLPELLKRFSVGVVYVSPVMFDQESPALTALQDSLSAAGVPIRRVWAGDRLAAGEECTIEVLHPGETGVFGSDNANSLVLAIERQGRRVLLTGDLEAPGMDELMAELPYDADLILAPHHGSARSNPPGFAAWSTPEWVVISGGRSSAGDEAAAAYRSHGANVLHTAEVGAVTAAIDDSQLAVRTHRPLTVGNQRPD